MYDSPTARWLSALLVFLLFLFVSGVEGVLERYQVFARFQRVEQSLLGLELFL